MRIVFVTNKRYPNPRGSSGGLEAMSAQLKALGHEVFFLASRCRSECQQEEGVFRFSVCEVGGSRIVWNPWAVRRRLNALLPDIVHTQQYDGLGKVAREWAIQRHIPWVQTVSDTVSVAKSRRISEVPTQVVAPAMALARMIERNGVSHNRLTVIPTGVVPEKCLEGNGDIVREEWSIPADARVLLSVSRLTQEKNTEFLFRSLLPLIRRNASVYLVCVGGGDMLDFVRDTIIEEQLQERILFADEVSQKKMKHYYAVADVFVYASKEDYRATVVAEAMYAGLPVVAVRSGGSRERVMDKVTGLLVAEQEDAFLGAVARLLEDPDRAKALGQGGRLSIEQHATIDKVVESLLEVYDRARKER